MCFLGIEHVDYFKMHPNMNVFLHLKNAPKIKKYLGNMEIIFGLMFFVAQNRQRGRMVDCFLVTRDFR